MQIFPAIDLIGGEAVRLLKGDYAQKTVYSDDPARVAMRFAEAGARNIHIVDLEGALDGGMPNRETVFAIKRASGLFCEIGGGIRSMDAISSYLDGGIDRVIIGTAAVTNPDLVREAVATYGERIAVGIDVRDGFVSIKGWTEQSAFTLSEFVARMAEMGVSTLICTDISKDGAMQGTNLAMYRELSRTSGVNITASGGVSTLDDVAALARMGLYAAIIGKAYYTGDIDLAQAVRLAEGVQSEEDAREDAQAAATDAIAAVEANAVAAAEAQAAATADATTGSSNFLSPEELCFDERGLIPAIVVDAATKRVLTLAYMNRESLLISLEKGLTCFWSRSRQELWLKGETSGNYQHIVSITADCDADALVVEVIPDGPACHLGTTSCFERPVWVASAAVAREASNA